jgi:hypothetical protein
MHGRLMESLVFNDFFGQWNNIVRVADWAGGMYQFVMQSGGFVMSKRVVVNK